MRRALIVCWLLVPVAAAAYHFGPGQDDLLLDEVAAVVAQAESHARTAERNAAAEGDDAACDEWQLAVESYEEALRRLPAHRVAERRRIRLELAKGQMFVQLLPTAHAELEKLIDELSDDPSADPALVADVRDALANSQYYMTWLMRLEGAPREEWEPKIEGARQNYKWLAECAHGSGDAPALAAAELNLEASIRLARMDLKELQGLPLPSQ